MFYRYKEAGHEKSEPQQVYNKKNQDSERGSLGSIIRRWEVWRQPGTIAGVQKQPWSSALMTEMVRKQKKGKLKEDSAVPGDQFKDRREQANTSV